MSVFTLARQLLNNVNYVTKTVNPVASRKHYVFDIINFHKRYYSNAPTLYEIVDDKKAQSITKDVIKTINEQIVESSHGRLFAIVHVAGKQFKVTEGDALIIEGYWPPITGDKISLDKVLMVGSTDFTLIGRPLIQSRLVNVCATVIEKTLSHTKTHFRKKRRKQYQRIHFYRIPQTMLRINKVEFIGELNKPPEIESVDRI